MGDTMVVLFVAARSQPRSVAERELPKYAPVEVVTAADGGAAVDALSEHPVDCVVTEASDDSDAVGALRAVRDADPAVPVVVFERADAASVASEAISWDVTEYVEEDAHDDPLAELARTTHDAATTHRAEQDVAMLNELARNVYERITDGFFALDRDWRFTYLNDAAKDLLEVEDEEALGENIWDAFPDAIGTDFYTEYHRAMATQEPVTVHEYYPPLDKTFAVRAFPSEDGLSVHFRSVVDEAGDGDRDPLLELASVLSSDLSDSIDAVREDVADVEAACEKEDVPKDEIPIEDVRASLDRMESLVDYAIRLAGERTAPSELPQEQ
ncbi:MAG: PAS domain-containing protein [Halobacterium sp.]